MRNLLFCMLALAGSLFASEPPDVGAIITSQMIDPLTVVNFHEKGVSLTVLDPQTMEVNTSYATTEYPELSTSWVSGGVTHTVTTALPTGSPSSAQILTAMARHKRLVDAMQAVYPVQP